MKQAEYNIMKTVGSLFLAFGNLAKAISSMLWRIADWAGVIVLTFKSESNPSFNMTCLPTGHAHIFGRCGNGWENRLRWPCTTVQPSQGLTGITGNEI
jgi:hypothetical protein